MIPKFMCGHESMAVEALIWIARIGLTVKLSVGETRMQVTRIGSVAATIRVTQSRFSTTDMPVRCAYPRYPNPRL
jgi:hypothetical protein